jgi:hypothetical protein
MRTRVAVLGIVGISSVMVGLVPTAAVARSATPVTFYAYEEVGPHSLLADPSTGVQFMDPTCSPSFTNCKVFEFADRLDIAPTATETDTSYVEGYLDDHAFDYFSAQTTTGTLALTLTASATTWTGKYSGTFRGPNAGTGTFALTGSDGSRMSGSIIFVDDGLMELTGTLR